MTDVQAALLLVGVLGTVCCIMHTVKVTGDI